MLEKEVTDFCVKNNIICFNDPIDSRFATTGFPVVKGFVIGFRDQKLAITLGPELNMIFLVSLQYFIENAENCAVNCKYLFSFLNSYFKTVF